MPPRLCGVSISSFSDANLLVDVKASLFPSSPRCLLVSLFVQPLLPSFLGGAPEHVPVVPQGIEGSQSGDEGKEE